jgi:hypothetical protein
VLLVVETGKTTLHVYHVPKHTPSRLGLLIASPRRRRGGIDAVVKMDWAVVDGVVHVEIRRPWNLAALKTRAIRLFSVPMRETPPSFFTCRIERADDPGGDRLHINEGSQDEFVRVVE